MRRAPGHVTAAPSSRREPTIKPASCKGCTFEGEEPDRQVQIAEVSGCAETGDLSAVTCLPAQVGHSRSALG